MAVQTIAVHDQSPDMPDEIAAPMGQVPVVASFTDAFKNAYKEAEAKDAKTAKSTAPAADPAKQAAADPVKQTVSDPTKTASPDASKVPDFAKDIPPAIKSTKAAEEWKKLKETHSSELKSVSDRLSLEKTTIAAEAEAAKKQAREYSEKLAIVALERHPEFQQKYTVKEEAAYAGLKQSAGKNGDKLVELLKTPKSETRDSQINEILGTLDPLVLSKVGYSLVRIEDINNERSAELASANEKFKAMTEAELSRQQSAQNQARVRSESTFNKEAESARNLDIFTLREGDNEHNSEVNGLINQAKALFIGNNTEEGMARAALWSAAGPKLQGLLSAQIALNAKLQAQIEKMSASGPALSSAKGQTKAGATTPAQEQTFVGAFMNAFRGTT